MRASRPVYDILKKIHDSNGSSKDIRLDDVHQLLQARLIVETNPHDDAYVLKLTPKGLACIEDRPLELPKPKPKSEPEVG